MNLERWQSELPVIPKDTELHSLRYFPSEVTTAELLKTLKMCEHYWQLELEKPARSKGKLWHVRCHRKSDLTLVILRHGPGV